MYKEYSIRFLCHRWRCCCCCSLIACEENVIISMWWQYYIKKICEIFFFHFWIDWAKPRQEMRFFNIHIRTCTRTHADVSNGWTLASRPCFWTDIVDSIFCALSFLSNRYAIISLDVVDIFYFHSLLLSLNLKTWKVETKCIKNEQKFATRMNEIYLKCIVTNLEITVLVSSLLRLGKWRYNVVSNSNTI